MKNIGVQIKDKDNNNIYPNPFPIGAVYMSVDGRDPSQIFGGTWTKIQGCFLWATYSTPKSTGGSRTHSHNLNDNGYAKISMHGNGLIKYKERSITSDTYNYQVASGGTGGVISESSSWGAALGGITDSTSTLPPYFEVYVWYRVG